MDSQSTSSKPPDCSENRRKIRDSCNNCSTQKIRCGKQRPSCARCTAKCLECSYSYSQRTGRRTSSHAAASHSAAESSPSIHMASPILEIPAPAGDTQFLVNEQLSQPPNISTGSLESFLFPVDHPQENLFSSLERSLNLDFLATPVSERDSSANFPDLTNNDGSGNVTIQDFMSLPTDNPVSKPDHASIQTNAIDIGDYVSCQLPNTASKCPSLKVSIGTPMGDGHDCMSLVLHIVGQLHELREPCSALKSTSHMPLTDHQMRDVDTVLLFNREAARSIKKILDCTCSSDYGISLMCYLATSGVVNWYGAALGFTTEEPENSNYHTDIYGPISSLPAMTRRVVSLPLFMGKYCLDSEVHRAVRAQVVLRELKEHVQPLLSRLPKYSSSGLELGSEAPYNKGFNQGYPCVLRNQLRRVMQSATSLTAVRQP